MSNQQQSSAPGPYVAGQSAYPQNAPPAYSGPNAPPGQYPPAGQYPPPAQYAGQYGSPPGQYAYGPQPGYAGSQPQGRPFIQFNQRLSPNHRNYFGFLYASLSVVGLFVIISVANSNGNWFTYSLSGDSDLSEGWQGYPIYGLSSSIGLPSAVQSTGKLAAAACALDIILIVVAMLALSAVAFPCSSAVESAVNSRSHSASGPRLLLAVQICCGFASLMSFIGSIAFIAAVGNNENSTCSLFSSASCSWRVAYAWALLLMSAIILAITTVIAHFARVALAGLMQLEDRTAAPVGVYTGGASA